MLLEVWELSLGQEAEPDAAEELVYLLGTGLVVTVPLSDDVVQQSLRLQHDVIIRQVPEKNRGRTTSVTKTWTSADLHDKKELELFVCYGHYWDMSTNYLTLKFRWLHGM